MTNEDIKQRAEEIVDEWVLLDTPTGKSLAGAIEQALELAYKEGQRAAQSSKPEWPSEDDIEAHMRDVIGGYDYHAKLLYDYIKQRMNQNEKGAV